MRKTVLATLIALVALCASAVAEETAEDWVKKGDELYENGSYEEAANSYDKAIQMDPSNADAWFGKGNAVKILYKNPEDTTLYESIGHDPQYADAWAVRGDVVSTNARLEEATENYEKALQLYDERLKKDPRDIDAWLNKGRALNMLDIIYYTLGDNESSAKAFEEEALQAYDKAIEINPENSRAWSAKALSLSGYEALEAHNRAIELDPKNEKAWLAKANSFIFLAYETNDNNHYEEAIESIDEALDINPSDSRTWSTKGYLLLLQGEYKEATKAYNTAIELTPQDKLRWFAKNVLYTYDKALEDEYK